MSQLGLWSVLGEAGSYPSEGKLQQQDRLVIQSESKQAKSKGFLLPCSFMQAATRGVARFKVGLLTSNNSDFVSLPTSKDPTKKILLRCAGVSIYVGLN